MYADVKGCLNYMKEHPKKKLKFIHNGIPMTQDEVKKVLEYALSKGYETTKDILDNEIEQLLEPLSSDNQLKPEA